MPQPLPLASQPVDDDRPKQFVEPLWSRRAKASQVKNNAQMVAGRSTERRESPMAWASSVKPNTTQSQKERPAAGHMVKGRPSELRTRERLVDGQRTSLQVRRSTGVTAEDRAMTQTVNDSFFAAAKAQDAIEKARVAK